MSWIEPLPGNDALPVYFESISARAASFETAFALIVESFHQIEEQRFAEEGPGWAPLAQSTLDSKDGEGGILVRTGDLEGSLTGGAFSRTTITPDMVEMVTTVPYAGFHQFGTTKMPRREIVDLTAATAGIWGAILATYLLSGEEFEG